MKVIVLVMILLVCGCDSSPQPKSAEEKRVRWAACNHQSVDFNHYFKDLAILADTEVPHKFSSGELFDQQKINENFMAIIAGLDKKKVLHAR